MKKKVTVRFFWTLLKAVKGKIIVNSYWELAYPIKQTRRDRMANTVGDNIFTVILCMVRLLFVMTVNHLKEKLCFDTCCYYFSVFQSLLFCSKVHMCK